MQKIHLIKFGGSLITDKNKPYTVKKAVIRRLIRELKTSPLPLILVHGSGSFGHTSALLFGGKKGYQNRLGIAKVAHDAKEINRIVMEIALSENLPAISLSPLSMFLAKNGETDKHFLGVIGELLSQNLLPVCYGDVIFDSAWKSTIYSGETILTNIALALQRQGFGIDSIIHVGKTDGVYDEKGQTIPVITPKHWQRLKKSVGTSESPDVTGGMRHKVEQALDLTRYGITTWIINGSTPNQLTTLMHDKKVITGTRITKEP